MTSSTAPARLRSRIALATTTLLVAIASHAVRETARDSLFLGDLPATALPWAYLSIAVGALGVGVANRALIARFSHRRLLVATLLAALGIDLLFWRITADPSPGALFGVYVWTGVLGTAVTMQLWLHVAGVFDVREAKRAFPLVGAGGLAGAVLGSVLAGSLLLRIETHSLLLASGALLLATAAIAGALPTRGDTSAAEEDDAPEAPLLRTIRSPYLLRITLLAVCVAVLATGIDYVFKHSVAASVPPDRLGSFFAWFHAGVNAFAMLFELLLAARVLRFLGVTRTLAILPACLLVASGSFVAVGGFAAALAQKFVDGALRPSLHQASTEVLFQPLSSQARNAAKTAAESIGKRGGQGLASIAILLVAGLHGGVQWVAVGLVPVALVALLAIRGLRADYVDRFRERLSGLAEDARSSAPRLDLHSLEALVSNLSSPDDNEVLAAIELLHAYGRIPLIPPLLLHHPSRRVVVRALEILRDERHPHLDAILERLLHHAEAEVRAAALNALVARGSGSVPLTQIFRTDPSAVVRSTAVVALAARHQRSEETLAFLRGLLDNASEEGRLAVIRALPRLPQATASRMASDFIERGDPAEAAALAHVLANEPALDPGWIESLIALLAHREARSAARAALLRQGEDGLRAAARALEHPDTDASVRRHLPRTIHRFGGNAAAAILVRNLAGAEPRVHYKILRGLGRLRADDPEVALDDAAVEADACRSLERAIELLAFRVANQLASGADAGGGEDDLLARVLADEESRALERVFRALHVLDPTAEFDAIFTALRSPGEATHAEGRELIEHVVGESLREGLLAMTRAKDSVERLRAATRSRGSDAARALARALPEAGEPAESDAHASRPALRRVIGRLIADPDPVLAELARHRFAVYPEAAS